MVLGLKIDNCGHPRMPNMTIHMQPGVPACTGSTPFAFLTHPHLHNGGVGISTFYLNPVLADGEVACSKEHSNHVLGGHHFTPYAIN